MTPQPNPTSSRGPGAVGPAGTRSFGAVGPDGTRSIGAPDGTRSFGALPAVSPSISEGASPLALAGSPGEAAAPDAAVSDASLPDAAKAVFIDWGPALPGRFPTGRARLLVVNPTTLHLSWEVPATSAHAAAESWIAEVRVDGGIVSESRRVDGVPGYFANSCWLSVSPRTSGTVRLLAVEAGLARRVADLPFETPPAAPSTDFTERWGSLDRLGALIRDAEAVDGARVAEVVAAPPKPQTIPTSSTPVEGRARG